MLYLVDNPEISFVKSLWKVRKYVMNTFFRESFSDVYRLEVCPKKPGNTGSMKRSRIADWGSRQEESSDHSVCYLTGQDRLTFPLRLEQAPVLPQI